MRENTVKPRVLDLLSFARERERNLIANLSATERAAIGTPDHWASKDHIVSIMRWRELQVSKLAQAVRGETPPDWRDPALCGRINAETFERYRGTPIPEIEAESERAYHELVAQVQRMSEEELASTDRFEWAEGEPLWKETLGNGLWYPFTQMLDIAMECGDRDLAIQLQDDLIAEVRASALSGALGEALYNGACFYALHGWPDKALALLQDALRERPTLTQWSRLDSDLDSLRADPRYQAMYADAPPAPETAAADLIAPHALADVLASPERPLVIDVRGPSEFASGHVAGAVNIPLGTLERKATKFEKGQPIVTYCNMHHRGISRGERAGERLRALGFSARTLDGGYPAWKEAGLAVE